MPEYEEQKPWPKLELSPTKTEKTMRKICRAALDTYGAAAQTLMCMEEMSELQKGTLQKFTRSKEHREYSGGNSRCADHDKANGDASRLRERGAAFRGC